MYVYVCTKLISSQPQSELVVWVKEIVFWGPDKMGLWGAYRRHLVGPNALSMAVSQFSRLEFCMWSDNNPTMFFVT